MVPLVFLINGLMKPEWMEVFPFAMAAAVGPTSEMLADHGAEQRFRGTLATGRHPLEEEVI